MSAAQGAPIDRVWAVALTARGIVMSSLQRFFLRIFPRAWGEAMEASSRNWLLHCPCGHERSVWETGGIRWGASGKTALWGRCPGCDKNTWQTLRRRAGA